MQVDADWPALAKSLLDFFNSASVYWEPIREDIDINIQTNGGETALIFASLYNNKDIVRLALANY